MISKNTFYNYIYVDPRKPGKYTYPNINMSFLYEPFYVGKGTKLRAYAHLKENNLSDGSHKSLKIKSILNSITKKEFFNYIIIIASDNEENAYICEYDLIKNIGRKINKSEQEQGPLTNIKEGGFGAFSGSQWDNSKIYDFIEDKLVNVGIVREFNAKWSTVYEGNIESVFTERQLSTFGRFCLKKNKDLPEFQKYKETITIYYKDCNYKTTLSNVDVLVNGSGDFNKMHRGERHQVNGYFIDKIKRDKYYKLSERESKEFSTIVFDDEAKRNKLSAREIKETQTIYHISGISITLNISEVSEFEKTNNIPSEGIRRLFRKTRKSAHGWYLDEQERNNQTKYNKLLEQSSFIKHIDGFMCKQCKNVTKCRPAHLIKKNFICSICSTCTNQKSYK